MPRGFLMPAFSVPTAAGQRLLPSADLRPNPVLLSLFGALLAVLNFVQVPQWDVDWKECSVSVPDTACHWYVVDPDNTFGKGFSWITAPSFDAEGVRDIALQRQATEAKGYRTTVAWMDAGSDVPYGDDY